MFICVIWHEHFSVFEVYFEFAHITSLRLLQLHTHIRNYALQSDYMYNVVLLTGRSRAARSKYIWPSRNNVRFPDFGGLRHMTSVLASYWIDMYLKVYSSYRSLVFYSHLTSWSDIVNVLQSFCYRFWASVLKSQIRSTLWQIQVRFWITSTCGKSSAQCYLFQTQLTASSRCASLRIYIFEYMIQSMSCILFQMSNSENRRCAYNFLSNIIVTTLSRWLIQRE